ncbi:hypothetical protein E2P81_ATG06271 [Venturia nashicola]|uniref:BRCT domain-containing protein n=1 Tax=Venturia nashicola TaxID=86259 RepID=A0A4Z1P893_9PEZI|nr:hypothetical protein E6O75_ATG06420 [Venturia nashicola]TLD27925.1 hypothetical protein E2P81_ATG06271 [Venturia nashicola]
MAEFIHTSKPFPNHFSVEWTDKIAGTQRVTIQTGHNIISRTFEGRLIVEGDASADAQEESQRPPKQLAIINAESLTFGPGESHFQLELTALTYPYIYVRRSDRSKIILLPDGDPVKCYALSHGDTIHFVGSNTTFLVHMRPEDVQVASSPAQGHVATDHIATETVTPLALNSIGTPDMSIPLEQVTETPVKDTIAESETGEEDEQPYLSNLDLQSRRPRINTVVPSDLRKRSRDDDDENEEAEPTTKKSRQDSREGEEEEPERVTTIDEDEPELAAPAIRKRDRPGKEARKAPVPQKKSAATPKPEKAVATPRSSVRSAASRSNDASPALSSFDDSKPKVVFSDSSFCTLVHQKSQFEKVAVISPAFNKKTTILCIGGGLKKTSKILSAVALGKPIVSDTWAKECAKAKRLLDIEPFYARDEKKEKEWDIPLTWPTGRSPCEDLLKGYTLYVTPSLKNDYGSGWKAIEDLAKLVGVKKVISKPSRAAPPESDRVILMGLSRGDIDAVALHKEGRKIHEKDLLVISILRGELCLDDFETEPELELPFVNKRGGKNAKK